MPVNNSACLDYSGIPLTPEQWRALERIAARRDRVLDSDKAFFALHRGKRRHRIRRADPVEIEEREILHGPLPLPPSFEACMAVRLLMLSGSVTVRLLLPVPQGRATDTDEATAEVLFAQAASPATWAIEHWFYRTTFGELAA